MKKLLLLAGASVMLLVGGCATYGAYGGGYGYGYDYYGPGYDDYYGPDVWYDGYYGPYYGGYWGDGGFYYRDNVGHYHHAVGGAHFRSRAFSGGQHFSTNGHRR